jgi:putative membrane protein
MMWDDGWGWNWFWMTIAMMGVWTAVVIGIIALVRSTRRPQRVNMTEANEPEGVLAERFARGGINAAEFERRLDLVACRPSGRQSFGHQRMSTAMNSAGSAAAVRASTARGPLAECPSCGSIRLVAVHNGDEANFLCEGCGRCWHVGLARVSRVDPLACNGCRHREICLARVQDDEEAAALK